MDNPSATTTPAAPYWLFDPTGRGLWIPIGVLATVGTVGIGLPLTNALTKVQADYHPLSGKTSTGRRRLGLWEMIKRTWREEGGWKGVLRGVKPLMALGLAQMILLPSLLWVVHNALPFHVPEQFPSPLPILLSLPITIIESYLTRAILLPYSSCPTASAIPSVDSILPKGYLPLVLLQSTFNHSLMALRDIFFVNAAKGAKEGGVFFISLLLGSGGQGWAERAKWLGWAVVMGLTGVFVGAPLEVIKVRLIAQHLQTQQSPTATATETATDEKVAAADVKSSSALVHLRPSTLRPYTSVLDAFRTIVAEEGWAALLVAWRCNLLVAASLLIA